MGLQYEFVTPAVIYRRAAYTFVCGPGAVLQRNFCIMIVYVVIKPCIDLGRGPAAEALKIFKC